MIDSPRQNSGALIYAKNTKRFLFLLRSKDKRYKGTWGIVGGRLETNEYPIDGLCREITEEIKLEDDTKIIVPLALYKSENNEFEYQTFIIIVDNEFIPILNDEHSGFAWTKLENYPKPLHPGLWKTINIDQVKNKISEVTGIFS